MQSRFWISTHRDFEDAARAKKEALNDKPEGVFQIRRGYESGRGQIFRLVERFKSNEVRAIVATKNKKNKKGRRRAFSLVG